MPEVRVDGIGEKTAPRLENVGRRPAFSREFSPSDTAFYGKETEMIVIILLEKSRNPTFNDGVLSKRFLIICPISINSFQPWNAMGGGTTLPSA